MKARVHYVAPYDLPDELEEGDEITVTSFSASYCEVRDLRGREFRLFMGCVDCGTPDEIGKRWLASDHPRVLQECRRYDSLRSDRQREITQREEDWGRRPVARRNGIS